MGVAEHNGVRSNFNKASGKWYWEITIDSGTTHYVGVATSSAGLDSFAGGDEHAYSYHDLDGKKYTYGVGSTYGDTYAAGDVIGVALDLDGNKVFFSKNGVWQDSGDPAAGTDPAYSITAGAFFAIWSGYDGGAATANFGNSAFSYDPPVGYTSFGSGSMRVIWDEDNTGSSIGLDETKMQASTDLPVPSCGDAEAYVSVDGATIANVSKLAGKWYWEVSVTIQNKSVDMTPVVPSSDIRVGVMTSVGNIEIPCGDDGQGYSYCADGKIRNSGVAQDYGDVYDTALGVKIGVALDLDNHKVWFSKDGVWQNGGDPESGANPAYVLPSVAFFPAGSPAGASQISC